MQCLHSRPLPTIGAQIREHPMGKSGRDAFRVGFGNTVNLKFHGTTVRSDADLLLYRDLGIAAR